MHLDGPRVSAVVCTRDRPDDLSRALTSLAGQADGGFEVLVIDQSTSPETQQLVGMFQARFSSLRYIRQNQPGLSRAYNRAVLESGGELLAFTDDDCTVAADWVGTVREAFDRHREVDLVYGRVLVPLELAESPARLLIPLFTIPRRRLVKGSAEAFGMGANFAVRKAVMARVGGFDEILGGGGPLQSTQDFDFSYRVLRSGGTILLEPALNAYHYGIRPLDDWPKLMASYGVGLGGFYWKHIRLGDLRAARLLASATSRALGQAMKATALHRSDARVKRRFVASIFGGIRKSSEFSIDSTARVYTNRPERGAA
jgi:GT2 family glycosyltransferase